MSKQDYNMIARVLSGIDDSLIKAEVVIKLGVAFQATNTRFNLEHFVAACMSKS